MPELSIVVPMHNEIGNVAPLVEQIRSAVEPLERSYEILLVDDGSTDGTTERLEQLAAQFEEILPIYLDSNFGQAAALSAGFAHAQGAIVLTLDGDLQNDPAELPRLLARLEAGGYRVVSGWRRQRSEGKTTTWGYVSRVLPSRAANRLIAVVTGLPSEDNGCSLKAYRSEVVHGVQLPAGMHRFIPAVLGVRRSEFAQIEVSHHPRHAGQSHYGLSRISAVLRDLLVLPYLLHGSVRPALAGMTLLLLATGLVLAEALVLYWRHPGSGGLAIAGICAVVTAYAECVRGGLERWQAAQREGVYRLRGHSSSLASRPSTAEVSARPTRGKLRA